MNSSRVIVYLVRLSFRHGTSVTSLSDILPNIINPLHTEYTQHSIHSTAMYKDSVKYRLSIKIKSVSSIPLDRTLHLHVIIPWTSPGSSVWSRMMPSMASIILIALWELYVACLLSCLYVMFIWHSVSSGIPFDATWPNLKFYRQQTKKL